MSASREKKLRQDQTASGYVDPKAEKELEEKKAEKRSNVLYSVIAVLFVLVVAASFLWRSNVISRNATALTIDGETYSAAEVNFYYQNVYRGFLQSNSYFISYLGLDTNASLKSQTVNDERFVTSGYAFITNPADASFTAWAEAVIHGQDVTVAGQMTFTCAGDAPTGDITVKIIRLEATEA